ncbi:hypothetical protein ACP4OV_003310 [Aristida adscensionis]
MASSAFRSTSRRTAVADDRPAPAPAAPCPRRSRSRSVTPASRARAHHDAAHAHAHAFANTRTNPLFDAAASPSASPAPPRPRTAATSGGGADVGRRERGRALPHAGARSAGGCGGGGGGRTRSASVAPERRGAASADTAAAGGGRKAPRPRSVADGARLYRGSETDSEAMDAARKLQSRRSQHSVPRGKHGGDGTYASCSSQGSTTKEGCGQMDGTTHSVSGAAVSSPGDLLEHAIWQQNHSTVQVDPVLEIPPEFDPDCAEFVSDMSDYATEYRKTEVGEIHLDFDTDAAELVYDGRHNVGKQHWEQIEIPLEFDPDAAALVPEMRHRTAEPPQEQMEITHEFDPDTSQRAPDITEYTIKLKQSHERARKLRADLAVEEQREQELSRMLKDIVTVPNFTETNKKRPRRKSSIERLKVSRHLAEEAMSYFEECVSISTMDSTDFSSPEDPQPNSVVNGPPKSNSRFLHKGGLSCQEPHTPTDHTGHHEEYDKQTQCSISMTGSDLSDNVICSQTSAPGLKIRNNSSDDLDGFDTPRSRSSCFSFTHEPVKTVENCDVCQYLGNFGMGNTKELRQRSSYFTDDYLFKKTNADLVADMVTFQNRIEYGGFLVCNIRTF